MAESRELSALWEMLMCRADDIADRVTVAHRRAGLMRGYRGHRAYAQIRRGNRLHMRWGIEGFAGDRDATTRLIGLWRDTVEFHARHGVTEEVVLSAYLLGTRALWTRLTTGMRVQGIVQADLTQLASAQIWRSMDAQSAAISAVYAHRRQDAAWEGADILDDLVSSRRCDTAYAESARRALRLPARAKVACVAGVLDPANPAEPLDIGRLDTRQRGVVQHWHRRPGVRFGLIAINERVVAPGTVGSLLAPAVRGPVALAWSREGIAGFGAAFRQAVRTAGLLPPGEARLHRVTDWLPQALLQGDPDLADTLVEHTLQGVLEQPGQPGAVLFRTLELLLRSSSSTARVADLMGVHRNTVLHRRHRIEELTGRSLSDPDDVLVLSLAVRALEIRRTPPVLPGVLF